MQLCKTQIKTLLTEVVSQKEGSNVILRMSFEAMMKAERQEYSDILSLTNSYKQALHANQLPIF
ncbi:MAG: hypothetical protein RIQ78_696 [Bacteroidota bacterium]|jgi:hypothetical protein